MAKPQISPADMPLNKAATSTTGDGDRADMDVNKALHKFCGTTCEVKLFKGAPQDGKDQFFNINNYSINIQRDKWVRVPVEMADHIESLYQTVKEPDPADPENPDAFIWAERQRFPMQRRD